MLGFPSGSVIKNLPTMQEPQEMWVQSLGQEDPPEEGTATHFSILAWRISWTEESGGVQSMGSPRVGHNCTCTHTHGGKYISDKHFYSLTKEYHLH